MSTLTENEREALNELFASLPSYNKKFQLAQVGSELHKLYLLVINNRKKIFLSKRNYFYQKDKKIGTLLPKIGK